MLAIACEPYARQRLLWPSSGRHILANYDEATVVVYQAYRPSIARHVLTHGRFGGPDFSFGRMSWIKPGFLWMMYRSGWATKPGQEMVLALRVRRRFFDDVVAAAVSTSHDPSAFASVASWRRAGRVASSRVQWDPDHGPGGGKLERRAIQLGLRGDCLRAFATTALVQAIDMTPFVHRQRNLRATDRLLTPRERIYSHALEPPSDGSVPAATPC